MTAPRRTETIEAFMSRALYDPLDGYYARHIAGVGGREADFRTCATGDATLGRALGAWARRRLSETGVKAMIEVGGGSGELARHVLSGLPWWKRIRFIMVEKSGPLREQQMKILAGKKVDWHETMESALKACGGCALIYSNELVDAFPCRQLEWHASQWWERAVEWTDQGARETRLPVSQLPDSLWIKEKPREGQRVEIHQSYAHWLRSWASAWRRGLMLTIDYGYGLSPLPRLPWSGTLRAYFRHLRLEGEEIFRRVGQQDLTADVCRDDVRRWGEALGWHTRGLMSQAEWIACWSSQHSSPVADADGIGGAFWVLEQECGASAVATAGNRTH